MSSSPQIILGTNGQVGRALREIFLARGEKPLSTSRSGDKDFARAEEKSIYYFDLEAEESVHEFFSYIAKRFPDQKANVYLCGALTNVDKCELEPVQCLAINVQGPKWVVEECKKAGHHLAYYSSEYVYGENEYHGGAIGPFLETAPPAPTSVYGRAKLAVEDFIRSTYPAALIIRTTMVYSYESEGMNFVMQVIRYLRDQSDTKPRFKIPVDQISTPTYAPALADASVKLLEAGKSGIYHLVGKDLLSRKDFVEKIIEKFHFPRMESMARFDWLKTSDLGQKARRPLTAGLATEKAAREGIKIWSIAEGLQDMLVKMEKQNG